MPDTKVDGTKNPRHLSERVLQCLRGRLGIEDIETDASKDEYIQSLPPRTIVREYAGFCLGDGDWGDRFIRVIEEAYGVNLP